MAPASSERPCPGSSSVWWAPPTHDLGVLTPTLLPHCNATGAPLRLFNHSSTVTCLERLVHRQNHGHDLHRHGEVMTPWNDSYRLLLLGVRSVRPGSAHPRLRLLTACFPEADLSLSAASTAFLLRSVLYDHRRTPAEVRRQERLCGMVRGERTGVE